MQTDNFDRLQSALALDAPPRRRRTPELTAATAIVAGTASGDETPAEWTAGLTAARARLVELDGLLQRLQADREASEARIEAELDKAEASRPASPVEGADFDEHLRAIRDATAHSEAVAALLQAAAEKRASSDSALKAVQKDIKETEAEVLSWLLRIEQARCHKQAAAFAETTTECKRLARAINLRLGRVGTHETIRRGAYLVRLPELPPMFIDGAEDSADVRRWKAARWVGERLEEEAPVQVDR